MSTAERSMIAGAPAIRQMAAAARAPRARGQALDHPSRDPAARRQPHDRDVRGRGAGRQQAAGLLDLFRTERGIEQNQAGQVERRLDDCSNPVRASRTRSPDAVSCRSRVSARHRRTPRPAHADRATGRNGHRHVLLRWRFGHFWRRWTHARAGSKNHAAMSRRQQHEILLLQPLRSSVSQASNEDAARPVRARTSH